MTNSASHTLAAVGGSRWWMLALGAFTVFVGILVMVWPQATVGVLAVLFGLQLLVAGVFQLIAAFAAGEGRALLVVLGILSILVGVLCLRAPFQTMALLVLLLGLTWLVGGIISVVHGFTGAGGWVVASGVVGVIAGIVVLFYPVASVITLAWLVGVSLVVLGVVGIATAFAPRRTPTAAPRPVATRPFAS